MAVPPCLSERRGLRRSSDGVLLVLRLFLFFRRMPSSTFCEGIPETRRSASSWCALRQRVSARESALKSRHQSAVALAAGGTSLLWPVALPSDQAGAGVGVSIVAKSQVSTSGAISKEVEDKPKAGDGARAPLAWYASAPFCDRHLLRWHSLHPSNRHHRDSIGADTSFSPPLFRCPFRCQWLRRPGRSLPGSMKPS